MSKKPDNPQEPMVFESLKPTTVDVTLEGKKFYLQAANTDDFINFRNAQYDRMSVDSEGNPKSFKNYADLDRMIVGFCLYDQSTHKKVPLGEIRQWPGEITAELAKRAKRISGLAKEEEEEEDLKNSQGGTQDGSE